MLEKEQVGVYYLTFLAMTSSTRGLRLATSVRFFLRTLTVMYRPVHQVSGENLPDNFKMHFCSVEYNMKTLICY